jgi:hypothetical protein
MPPTSATTTAPLSSSDVTAPHPSSRARLGSRIRSGGGTGTLHLASWVVSPLYASVAVLFLVGLAVLAGFAARFDLTPSRSGSPPTHGLRPTHARYFTCVYPHSNNATQMAAPGSSVVCDSGPRVIGSLRGGFSGVCSSGNCAPTIARRPVEPRQIELESLQSSTGVPTHCSGPGAPTEQQLIGCSDYTITGKPSAPTNSGTTQWGNAATTFGTIFGLAAPGAAAPGDDEVPGITFGHGARHLAGTGLDQGEVESTIQSQIQRSVSRSRASGSFWGEVTINGQKVLYRAYTLSNGTINVGTYYVVR